MVVDTCIFHHISGDIYYARMFGDRIISVSGPIFRLDADPDGEYDYLKEDADWLTQEYRAGRAWAEEPVWDSDPDLIPI